jgi:hypothetical protein
MAAMRVRAGASKEMESEGAGQVKGYGGDAMHPALRIREASLRDYTSEFESMRGNTSLGCLKRGLQETSLASYQTRGFFRGGSEVSYL